jgi:Ca2+-binding RTX toxin-like protein
VKPRAFWEALLTQRSEYVFLGSLRSPGPIPQVSSIPLLWVHIGREGQDTIHLRSGEDQVDAGAGSDTLFGEGAHDSLSGGGGVNLYFGGPGPDRIVANTEATETGPQGAGAAGEEIHGGTGGDLIFANDGLKDIIDCGGGSDAVANDPIDEVAANCEVHDPFN